MSTFLWIDHSEKQRRQIMEAIDAFRESDTRDELGLAGIRDTFSDLLFPGTGAVQSRARYFFFVPWMYQAFEAKRYPGSEFDARGKRYEIDLIFKLLSAEEHAGTIGVRAKESLKRLPSNVYWNGLRKLGFLQFRGTQWEFHQSVDRRRAEAASMRLNDDREAVGGAARAWHAGIPAAPATFPNVADFVLRKEEARYLRERILETQRSSLFAFMLDRPFADENIDYAWEHSVATAATGPLARTVEHARCFSAAFHGAAILYNLLLADLEPKRPAVVEALAPVWTKWLALVDQERSRLAEWSLADFWTLLAASGYVPSGRTRLFVEAWATLVNAGQADRLRGDEEARVLIFDREHRIKGQLARCRNPRAREKWGGDAGLGRMEYRWGIARTMLNDVAAGLEAGRA